MSRWHAVRIRDDLYRQIQAQAAADARSVAQMTDRLLSGALEQETNTSASSGGGHSVPGESERGVDVGRGARRERDASSLKPAETASSPARAPVAQRQTTEMEMEGLRNIAGNLRPTRQVIEGQTTVNEMLASCPSCAEPLVGVDGLLRCEDCGYAREPS